MQQYWFGFSPLFSRFSVWAGLRKLLAYWFDITKNKTLFRKESVWRGKVVISELWKNSWLWIILHGGKFIRCQEKKIPQTNSLVLISTHSSWSLVSRLSLSFWGELLNQEAARSDCRGKTQPHFIWRVSAVRKTMLPSLNITKPMEPKYTISDTYCNRISLYPIIHRRPETHSPCLPIAREMI